MPVSKVRGGLFVSGLALLGVGSAAPAQSVCQSAPERPYVRSAERAITAWQVERDLLLTPTARQEVVQAFCSGASRLASEERIPRRELSQAARESLWAYLDQMLTPGQQAIPLDDLLTAVFVPRSDPALPEPRRTGIIRIEYTERVNALTVGGRRKEPAPLLLAETGILVISGFTRGRRTCSGTVRVSTFAPAVFTC